MKTKKTANRPGTNIAQENITITLDALSSKLVRWYAEENDRDPVDVANGVIAGELGHLREEEESGFTDDSPEHVREYVMDAIGRRRLDEAKRGGPGILRLDGGGLSHTEKAILHLQDAVAERFGRDFNADSGRGTLYISHDSVSLTNPQSSIVAQRASSIARQLGLSRVVAR
ncbi:MAG: hypothetical protein QOE26_878 [Verrucomicrobiota bacterium]|jgi:hypothetical protein